jgi:thiol-disulfide isomerase/thioredoxin
MTPQNQLPKSSWSATQIGLIVSAIILLAALAFTFYHGERPNPTNPESRSNSAESAAPLPENVMQASINMLDGQKTRLADYSGKVLVVDLWATWCGPCVQEVPHLIEIAKEYKGKGVEVIGLTREDQNNTPEDVKNFSKLYNINYSIGWVDDEMQAELTRERQAIPQTYIIGRDGKVLRHYVGFNPRLVPQMKAAIESAASAE